MLEFVDPTMTGEYHLTIDPGEKDALLHVPNAGLTDMEAMGMASASTAHYHIEKLLTNGLIRTEGEGYVVDKVFLDNFIRIRRTAIPLQAALAMFFGTSLAILIVAVRPETVTSGYVLGVVAVVVGLVASILQSVRDLRASV
jgi:hypothetical protein